MIIISACLAGVNCRYDGGNNRLEKIEKLIKEKRAVLVCPEQLGGLSTPRIPCEIVGGDGQGVLENKIRVMDKNGEDNTLNFLKGAQETLRIAKLYGAEAAVLKARSPSCGEGFIYDGTFSGKTKTGDGVTAALLKQNNIKVFDERNFWEYIE